MIKYKFHKNYNADPIHHEIKKEIVQRWIPNYTRIRENKQTDSASKRAPLEKKFQCSIYGPKNCDKHLYPARVAKTLEQ